MNFTRSRVSYLTARPIRTQGITPREVSPQSVRVEIDIAAAADLAESSIVGGRGGEPEPGSSGELLAIIAHSRPAAGRGSTCTAVARRPR